MTPDTLFRAAIMSNTERCDFVDTGIFNEIIKGYLVCAMGFADFTPKEVKKALHGMHIALDEFSAEQAQRIYQQFNT